jgi:hypothetical protein
VFCNKFQPTVHLQLTTAYGKCGRSFTLRGKCRLRVFENRVLVRLFGPERDGVTRQWGKLHNMELSDPHSLPNIVWVIKSRRMRWAGYIACMRKRRGVYRFMVGNPEGKRLLGIFRKILRCIFRKWVVRVWTGLSWLRIGTGGGHL